VGGLAFQSCCCFGSLNDLSGYLSGLLLVLVSSEPVVKLCCPTMVALFIKLGRVALCFNGDHGCNILEILSLTQIQLFELGQILR
jgi:hypothetical protein